MAKGLCYTRTQTMDDFNHIIKILDIGISSELERTLQTEGIHSTINLRRMKDSALLVLNSRK